MFTGDTYSRALQGIVAKTLSSTTRKTCSKFAWAHSMGSFKVMTAFKEAMTQLHSVSPTTRYVIANTVVRETDENDGWVVERWGFRDSENNVEVTDGIDCFLISKGKIVVKMVNYNAQKQSDERAGFDQKVGTQRLHRL